MAMAAGISSAPGTVDDVVGRAGGVESRLGAVEQRVGHIIVEARLDDEEMGGFSICHGSPGTLEEGHADRRGRGARSNPRRAAHGKEIRLVSARFRHMGDFTSRPEVGNPVGLI